MSEPKRRGRRPSRRALVLVIDACGVGALPDAGELRRRGHEHARARRRGGRRASSCRRSPRWVWARSCRWPASRRRADPAIHGRLHPLGPGKDSIGRPLGADGRRARRGRCRPTPTASRQEVIARLAAAIGHEVICNRPYNGIAAIEDFGAEHLRTRRADPVHLAGLGAAAGGARRSRARWRSCIARARRRAR